jgi:hypothetical protein
MLQTCKNAATLAVSAPDMSRSNRALNRVRLTLFLSQEQRLPPPAMPSASAHIAFDTLFAYQRSATLKSAMYLGTTAGFLLHPEVKRNSFARVMVSRAVSAHSLPTPQTILVGQKGTT